MKREIQQKHEAYQKRVAQMQPRKKMLPDMCKAFIVGGGICAFGQGVTEIAHRIIRLSQEDATGFTAIVMVFLGALLTGLGIYDRIGSFAGAGSIVPITGFSNSVVAPAMEFKQEGYVMGVGAKLFSLAGPVLVYGTLSSVLVGILYLVVGKWM